MSTKIPVWSCVSCLLICGYSFPSYAGAWLQPPQHWLYATTQSVYRSHSYFDASGNRIMQPDFLKAESNHYVEYGYDTQWTLGANLFIHFVEQEIAGQNGAASNAGLADSELFAKYRLLDEGGTVLSVVPLIKLPSVYAQDQLPRAGSDGVDAELSLMGGHGFEWQNGHHFIDVRAGYRHRLDESLADQIKLDAKLGYELYPDWYAIPAAYVTLATQSPTAIRYTESGQNDYDLLKLEGSLLYNLDDRTYIQLGAFEHSAGRNTGEGYGAFFSIGRRY